MPQTAIIDQELDRIEVASVDSPDAQTLMALLNQRLAALSGDSGVGGFDAAGLPQGRSVFLIARSTAGKPLGCGALRPLAQAGLAPVAEVKRMFALDGTRGVGAALLARLEREAAAMGYHAIWLETRRVNERALRFYARHGYRAIPNFGSYVDRAEAICLGKTLGVAPSSPSPLEP